MNFGRPYSLPTSAIDCFLPADVRPSLDHTNEDIQFHQIKYRLVAVFYKIADCLQARELPPYSVVLQIDRELRSVESSAPAWLRWKDGPEVELPNGGKVEKMIPQQHMIGLLLHKGLLGELLFV